MEYNLGCISPVDGRYHKYTSRLKKYFSEFAFFKYRVMFEIEYFLFLKKIKLFDIKIPYIEDKLKTIYLMFIEIRF